MNLINLQLKLSIIITVVFTSSSFAQTFYASHKSTHCSVTECIIPDGYTTIAERAFWDDATIEKVILPNTVTSIQTYAFAQAQIKTIVLSNSLEEIHYGAFQNSGLTSLELPDSMKKIHGNAFINSKIENLHLGNGIERIEYQAFDSNQIKQLNIPNSIQSIGTHAFRGNRISNLQIGNSITTIGSGTFEDNNILNLVIPANITSIEGNAFKNNQIEVLELSEGNISLGGGSFSGNRISNLIIPDTIEYIGERTFEWNRLNVIQIGSGLKGIGVNAFANQVDLFGVPVLNTEIFVSPEFTNTESMTGVSGLETSTIIYCENLDSDNDLELDCLDENDDNDSAPDIADAFPLDPTEQLDTDGDGIGNNADPDDDNDGLADEFDDLPLNASEQHDFDNDGIGNNADADDDNDGLSDQQELILGTNSWLADTDLDGVNDGLDAFPTDNSESTDTDGDGIGNNADNDDDNDGYVDIVDAMPTDANEWADTDADGVGNNADTDDDNDGVEDIADAFPYTTSESVDTDGDGTGDNADVFPNDPTEAFDTDLDGIGNNADPDDDNDGVADADDDDPLNPDVTNQPKQLIAVMGEPVAVSGHFTNIFVSYDVSDANNQLNGIGFRVHYNNSEISLHNIQNTLSDSIVIDGMGPYQDIENFDSDESTDKYILFGWASIAGNWPNISLPENLTEIQFFVNTNDNQTTHITSNINFSIVDSAEGYLAKVVDYPMTILPATWDFDGNGKGDALTDGLMLLRYTFGLRDLAMTSGAVAENATLSSSQIAEGMEKAVAFADIDGNGSTDALTDGLMLLRYMFGLRGENLTRGAVSSDASRVSVESIENYISLYMPENTNIYTPITPAELASYQDCSEHKRHQETYSDDDSSDMYSTIVRVDDNSVKVSIVSANDDPIDYLNVTNLTGPSAYLGDLSISNGEASLIMSWLGGAPDAASFDIYWSKESYEGNWFVDKSIQPRVDLTATCDSQ